MQLNSSKSTTLQLETFDRLGSIPMVEKGIKHMESLYSRIKNSTAFLNWYLESAESTIVSACDSIQPALKLFEVPLKRLDNVMCKSLDILEQRIPSVYLPPEMMIWNTKEYMSDHLVKPVFKRADSVKQIGNAVLDNAFTAYAAECLEDALTAGDKLVDKYLQPIDGEQMDVSETDTSANVESKQSAIRTIQHGQRFSRKLKRRLTKRTIAEARALRKQSVQAINILIYAGELIVTNPKLALQKAKELWQHLSQDEPENQARPATLEQLIVLLIRESARRLVHTLNFGGHLLAKIPKTMSQTTTEVVHIFIYFNNRLITIAQLDKVKHKSKTEAETILKRMLNFYSNLQVLSNSYLLHLASFLSGRIEAEKINGNRNSSNTDAINNSYGSGVNFGSGVAVGVGVGSTSAINRRRFDIFEYNSSSTFSNINGVY